MSTDINLYRSTISDVNNALIERHSLMKSLLQKNGGDPVGLELKSKFTDSWVIVLSDASQEGCFRIQHYDNNGFSGHQTYSSALKALEEGIRQHFCLYDKGSLNRLSNSFAWDYDIQHVFSCST